MQYSRRSASKAPEVSTYLINKVGNRIHNVLLQLRLR